MATKKTESKKSPKAKKSAAKKSAPKAAAKAPKAPKPPKGETKALPRHPRARVTAAHESKAALAKSLAPSLARKDEDDGQIAERLSTASSRPSRRSTAIARS